MAAGPTRIETFTAAGTMDLGCAKLGSVSRWAVRITGTGWTGSVTPRAKPVGDDQADYREIGWYNMETVANVAAGGAPTADSTMLIDSTGMDVELVVVASGSVRITASPVLG